MISFRLRAKWQNCRGYVPRYERTPKNGWFDIHSVFATQQELFRPEYFLEIMPKKASKAEAIKRLKEIWHCDKVVSFGDAVNDIPMFEISDECYAVANAVPELKAHATGVIASNDEDGVAKWLEQNGEVSCG